MRTKTKYREYRDGGRINSDGQEELPIEQPVEAVSAVPEAPAAITEEKPPEQTQTPEPAAEAKPDDAALMLQRQLGEFRKSEELQRQQATANQQLPTRAQTLAAWRQQGISESEAAFFERNPRMIDFPQVTAQAAQQVMAAGHERGTPAHYDTLKKVFDENFGRLQAQANQGNNSVTETPAFFRPAPVAQPEPRRVPVSAPVSRTIPTSDRPPG